MSQLHSLHSFLQHLFSPPERNRRFDGVDLRRLGDVAREHGTTRWKQAPAGTGRNVGLVTLSLNANGIALYGHNANVADHTDGNVMSKAVLGQLHADDFVVTLDLACDTGRSIAAGTAGLVIAPVPDEYLALYRGDRIRAAALSDAMSVAEQVLIPGIRQSRAA